jgi:lactoylglutathione lyase
MEKTSMVSILKIDHIGIRVKEKKRAIDFYTKFGFELIADIGFEQGHPIMMRHKSGIVLNLLGPATETKDENVLMDIDRKYAGYTHIALKIESQAELITFLDDNGIEITGQFTFKDMKALFVRDPDRNVIEFDEYPGDEPESRFIDNSKGNDSYNAHP